MIFKIAEEANKNNFDVLIVGSGPAGISLALSLEKNGNNCIIIEAGSVEIEKRGSNSDLSGKVVGDNYLDLQRARFRQLGGASRYWGGNCSIFSESDFSDWPIKKRNLINTKKRHAKY